MSRFTNLNIDTIKANLTFYTYMEIALMKNSILILCLSLMIVGCGGGSTVLVAPDPTDGDSPVIDAPDSIAGSDKFQVIDEKLVMKSVDDGDFLSSEVLTYGSKGQTIPTPGFISIEGDLNLLSSIITGAASRARVTLEVRADSASTDEFIEIFMAFEARFAGVFSRAFLKTSNGVEIAITDINNLPLTKGTATQFKIEFLNDGINFARLTIGQNSGLIRLSALPASDIQFLEGSFNTYVEFPETGDFAQGSIDNIVLRLEENNTTETIIRDFSDYADGTAPVADEYFITVSSP